MEYYSLTDKGKVRKNNQDSVIVAHNLNGDLMALVCDGIGGNKAGDIASFQTVTYLSKIFSENEGFQYEIDLINFIRQNIYAVNKMIFKLSKENNQYKGMGTTIAGVFITSVGNYWINVGDSRVYGFFDKELKQFSDDHTLVNELIKSKLISPLEALNHPKKHHITKALGIWMEIDIDYQKIQDKIDYLLVCSDGLHGFVNEKLIAEVLIKKQENIIFKVKKLLNLALEAGGLDNISIILIKLNEVKDEK